MSKIKSNDMSLMTFLKKSNIINKHPEVFNSGKTDDIKKFIDIFENYNNQINSTGSKKNNIDYVEMIVKEIKNEFAKKNKDIVSEEIQQIESDKWNKHYIHYNNPDGENELYIFPRNNGGGKIMTNFKFLVNCFPIIHAITNSIKLVNRNGHMILAGDPNDSKLENGIGLSFKILFLYNTKYKKWIVSPFKIVSETNGVNCSAFKISASTDHVGKQFSIWNKTLEKKDPYTGILNAKFLNNKFKLLPNLFNLHQTNEILIKAKQINLDTLTNSKASIPKTAKSIVLEKSNKISKISKISKKKKSKKISKKKKSKKKKSKKKISKISKKKKSKKISKKMCLE